MNPNRRAERAETERLLDGTGDPDLTVADPVARLLAAAAGPTRPGELAGEDAALAAFRAARTRPTPTVAARPHRRRLTTGALAWMGALAATATAGAAFAAVTLERAPDPVPVTPSSPSPTPSDVETTPSGDRTAAPGEPTPGTPTPGTPSATSAPSATGTPTVTGTPSAGAASAGQLHGLCRAWQAKKPEQRDEALRTPAFQKLVTAAGGADDVEAYCERLAPTATPSTSAKVKPSHPATGRPAPE